MRVASMFRVVRVTQAEAFLPSEEVPQWMEPKTMKYPQINSSLVTQLVKRFSKVRTKKMMSYKSCTIASLEPQVPLDRLQLVLSLADQVEAFSRRPRR